MCGVWFGLVMLYLHVDYSSSSSSSRDEPVNMSKGGLIAIYILWISKLQGPYCIC
jgi:hypothetical protein